MSSIPAHWQQCQLRSVLAERLSNGRSVRDGDGFPVLRLGALRGERLDFSQHKTGAWSREDAERYVVEAGDLLVARGNGSLHLVGRASLVPQRPPNVAFPDTMIRVRPETSSVEPRFLAIQWNAPHVRAQIESAARTTAGIYKVNQGDLNGLEVLVPPLEEQKAIVAAIETHFSRLDAAVASLTRAKANVQRARASVLKAAVEGRLVPTEAALARAEGRDYEPASVLLARILTERKAAHEAAQEGAKRRKKYKPPVEPETEGMMRSLPEGWCWASVDQLAGEGGQGLCDGPFGSNLKTAHYTEEGPRVVRLQNIGDGEFRDEEAHISEEHFERLRKHEVRAGDLVIASLGEVLPRACVVPGWLGPALVKADCIRFRPTPNAAGLYLRLALNSPPVRQRTTDKIHGVGRPRLGLTGIREIALPLPPLAEQHRIAAEVDRRLSVLDAIDTTLDANLARCERLRQSILKRAFEGYLTPRIDPHGVPTCT